MPVILAHSRMLTFAAVAVCIAALPTGAFAQGNSIFVESKTVLPGQTGVTVGVYLSNAVDAVGFVMPIEIREIDSGVFPISRVSCSLNPIGRMYNSVLGPNPPACPPAAFVNNFYATSGGVSCSGPTSSTYSSPSQNSDGQSPDGVFFAAIQQGSEDDCSHGMFFNPDTETPGVHPPSIQLRFDAPTVFGRFEIDSCCVRPANHVMFVDKNTTIVPVAFTKGVVTIDCNCACLGDPVCDDETDILDLVQTIDVAFRSFAEVTDTDCMLMREDVNASANVDIVDVVLMVRAVFRGESMETIVTNPCN